MSGCPACVQHLGCTEYNAVLHKRAAVAILEITLRAEAEHRARVALQARSFKILYAMYLVKCLEITLFQVVDIVWESYVPKPESTLSSLSLLL
jgi:ATP-dependent helicase YprA (DUF1998 family)